MTEGEGQLVAGRYRLRRSLGRGGMGAVWLAEDEFLHRDVAIKEIQWRGRDIRESDPEVRRMLREARAAAKLAGHPGIINVYDVVMDNGLPWIVMERLHGGSLADAMQDEGPLPVHRAAQIGAEVLDALSFAHRNGVLHRDVKPGNIMLAIRPEGTRVVLTDFGIAVMDDDSALTATGQVAGAPEYISPERIMGQEAMPAADMWSVGITLYTMVVGRTPFQRSDVRATLAAALSQKPDPHPNIGRLWPVIQGLLRDKPAERMTAPEAIAKLREIAAIPAAVPDRVRVTVEPYTPVADPGDQVTVADNTKPNTRTVMPPLPVKQVRPLLPVRPDDPTLDPAAVRPGSKKPLWIGAGVAVVVIVALVVWVTLQSKTPSAGENKPPATTSVPPPSLRPYQEQLGFTIGVPADWTRSESVPGPIADVSWQGTPKNPAIGPLKVQVTKDTTKPGMTAYGYLADQNDLQRRNGENENYRQHTLLDLPGNKADLEYTHGSKTGPNQFHFLSRAYSHGDIHILTFSMFATDARTLEDQWQAALPTINRIRDSFQVTG